MNEFDDDDVAEPQLGSEYEYTHRSGAKEQRAVCHHCEERIAIREGATEWTHIDTDKTECE